MINWTDTLLQFRARKLSDVAGCLLMSAVAWPITDGSLRPSAPRLVFPSPVFIAAAEKKEPAHERSLIAQKLRLLEAYFHSAKVAAVRRRGDAAALELLAEAQEYLDDARDSFAAQAFSAAAASLDNGLRLVTRAVGSAKTGIQRPSKAQAERRYRKRRRLVRRYLEALARARTHKQTGRASDGAMTHIEDLVADSERLAGAGRYRDADKVLTQAYQAIVTTLTIVHKGRTLVSSLTFENAAEELEYERRRHGSYEMLVRIMIRERKSLGGNFPALADTYIDASRRLRDSAESRAAAGDTAAAIGIMEKATDKLIQALRAGGLAVPE